MDYNPISNFLDKFRKLIFQKDALKEQVILVLSQVLGHSIDPTIVFLKEGIISVKGSPLLRSEIMIHKKQILDRLKNDYPNNIFRDIN